MLCRVGRLTEQSGGVRARVGHARTWILKRPFAQLASWVGVLALLVSAPFGGWADVKPPPMTVAEVDEVVSTGPLDVTINRVSASTRPGPKFSEASDGQYLLVIGTVRSTEPKTLSNSELRDAVRLVGLDGLPRYAGTTAVVGADEARAAQPQPYFLEDATPMLTVGPELTYDVAWIWQRQGAVPPATVDVEIQKFTYRQRVLDEYTGWLDPQPMAHLVLPVTVRDPYVDPVKAG